MAGNLTAMIAAAFSGGAAPPVTTDPYFDYTTLLLPGNGTNGAQNNTFLDGSTNNFTITRNGNTTQGTFSPFSQTGWGNYFDGTGDYLTTSNSAGFASGTNNITIEWWMYPTSTATNQYLFDTRDPASGSSAGIQIGLSSAGKFFVYIGGNVVADPFNTVISANTWTHIALVRNSNSWKLFVNGTADSVNPTSSTSMTQQYCTIATSALNRDTSSTSKFNGYLSNIRFVNNRAVYTSNFTPPTSPLTRTSGGSDPPQGSETILLTSQSGRFLDSNGVNVPATSPLTITPAGNTSVVAFSPFNPSASWSAATYGGSGYFDGSGDYLGFPVSSAFTLGTNDFTIEGWLYPNTLVSGVSTAFVLDSNAYPRVMWYYVGGVFTVHVSTTGAGWDITQTCSVLVNQWNHLVLQRNGNDFRTFLNGSLAATTTASLNIPAQRSVGYVGRGDGGSQIWNGYVSGLRVVNGTAVYNTSGFTPPTSPPTAITNTSLLLNFTNAGIYDATSKNDLETVGNAQISTTQSKWGGSSMAFDGTGDYLLSNAASTDLYAFGSGDWTIECWVYFNNLTGDGIIYDGKLADGAYPTIYRSTSTIIYYTNGANRITSGTISATTWYHVAVSRSGTSVKLFINGVQAGSTYTDSQTYLCPANRPVIGAAGSSGFVGAVSLNGYLQDLRVTKGYARYTANFTAPTAAFPTL